MTNAARSSLILHINVLRDRFERAFPDERDFLDALPKFCIDITNSKPIDTSKCKKFAPIILRLSEILLDSEMLKNVQNCEILLENAILERILAENALFLTSDFSQNEENSKILDEKTISQTKNIVSYIQMIKALDFDEMISRRALGWGYGGAKGEFLPTNAQEIEKYAKIFREDEEICALAKKIGRHAPKSGAMTFSQKNHRPAVSRDGIRFSSDIRNVVPSEFALLAEKRAKLEFLRKFSDSELLCWKPAPDRSASHGKKDDRGEVIICLDTSGSMHGRAETISKACALAVISACQKEKRRVLLVSFSVEFKYLELDFSSKDEKLLKKIGDFVSCSFYGGTDIGGVLEFSLENRPKTTTMSLHDADIVLISDFNAPAPAAKTMELLRRAQKNGTRLFAFSVGNGKCPILAACDEILRHPLENEINAKKSPILEDSV